jgi:DNA-binding NarL/FixJ family response regulator
MSEVRVVVVDDHPVVAQGTAEIIDRLPGVRAMGYALGLEDVVRLVREARPHVVLCDVMLGDSPAGLDLPARLTEAGLGSVAVLFLTYLGDADLPDVNAVGGAGLVVKTIEPVELREAIIAVAGGAVLPAPAVGSAKTPSTEPRVPSEREAAIMRLIADGASYLEVARDLGISDRTVETHVGRLCARYKVAGRTQLVVFADRRGWLDSVDRTAQKQAS